MKTHEFLIDRKYEINAQYHVVLMALRVKPSGKFPDGLKVRYVLLDSESGYARLLVDNHEPFGFHMHTRLPEDHSVREILPTTDYNEALQIFLKEVERIVNL